MVLVCPPPGVELQGQAESPQFWGVRGVSLGRELETVLPPLVLLSGPETSLSPSSLSIILPRSALPTSESGTGV